MPTPLYLYQPVPCHPFSSVVSHSLLASYETLAGLNKKKALNISKMLSDFTLKGLKFLIKGGQRLRVSVYGWDDSSGQVVISKSKLTWTIVVLTVLYLMGQAVFETYQLVHLAGDPNEPFENYMKMVVQWSTRLLAVVIQFDSFMYGENKKTFANQILLLNGKFKGKIIVHRQVFSNDWV